MEMEMVCWNRMAVNLAGYYIPAHQFSAELLATRSSISDLFLCWNVFYVLNSLSLLEHKPVKHKHGLADCNHRVHIGKCILICA